MDDSPEGDSNECREVIHRIYHFLDGELTFDKRAQIQQHLDDCLPCIQAFSFESELRRVVSRGCREEVPHDLRRRIGMLIGHEELPPPIPLDSPELLGPDAGGLPQL